jgi:hypothetical protein
MHTFHAPDYGPAVAELVDDRLPELGPGHPNAEMRPKLAALSLESRFRGQTIADRSMAGCCLSGLWLWHDFLEESHELSQEIGSVEGSYWHGILHRREPDYGNAKYWFRRVGRHAIFPSLAAEAKRLAAEQPCDASAQFHSYDWDPYRFIDLCEAIARDRSDSEPLARQIARVEWELLFDYCWRWAVGR